MDNTFLPPKNIDGVSKLQRLRYHLACDGCSDSQLSLAKSFLQEATETSAESKENAELAIRWLLMSSSEGNEEALVLLENCYKMGIGVTPRTRDQIENCLRSTSEQKLAHRIGSCLFQCIAYDMQESIPLEFFQRQIKIYMKDEKETQTLDVTITQEIFSGANVTMKDVVSSVHNCLMGEYTELLLENTFSVNYIETVSNSTWLAKFSSRLMHFYLTSLGSFCRNLSEIPMILSFVTFAMVCFIVSAVVPPLYLVQYQEEYGTFLESVLSCAILILLLVTSTRMICHCNNITNTLTWSQLICKVSEKLDSNVPRPSLLPVVLNFVGFILGLFLFTMFNSSRLSSLLQFSSLVLLTLCILYFHSSESKYMSSLFMVNSLLLALTRLDIGNFNLLSHKFFVSDITVNERVILIKPPSLLFIFAVVLYLVLLLKCRFHTSLGLLVMSLWCNIITSDLSQNGSRVHLMLPILIIVLLHKKLGFYLTFYSVFVLSQLEESNMLIFSITIAIYFLSLKVTQSLMLSVKKANKLVYFKLCCLVMFLLLIVSTLSSKVSPYGNKIQGNITWHEYYRSCHPWVNTNIAHTQKKCDKFKGYSLAVEANVDKVVRKYSHIFKVPDILDCNVIEPIGVDMYEVSLYIKGTFRLQAELVLEVDGRCEQFVFDLREGDLLTIVGTLNEGLGTTKPSLIVEHADCISCMEVVDCHVARYRGVEMKSKLPKAVQFFLHPFIE